MCYYTTANSVIVTFSAFNQEHELSLSWVLHALFLYPPCFPTLGVPMLSNKIKVVPEECLLPHFRRVKGLISLFSWRQEQFGALWGASGKGGRHACLGLFHGLVALVFFRLR